MLVKIACCFRANFLESPAQHCEGELLCTIKALINAQTFIRIVSFHREVGGCLQEARVLTKYI